MAQITIEYDARNSSARKFLEAFLSLPFFKEKKEDESSKKLTQELKEAHKNKKSGIEEALEDIKNGNIIHYGSYEDYLKKTEKHAWCFLFPLVLKRFCFNKKRNLPKSELDIVVKLLSENIPIPKKYNDHALKGNHKGCRECHIRPDWLLVYQKNKKELKLLLMTTGTHSDIY